MSCLTPEQQVVLCRLAVFVGGCSVDAAGEIVRSAGLPHLDVVGTIHSLVDKSMLVATGSDEDEPRFTMLETIREYALERLDKAGVKQPAYAAYARYYLTLAEKTGRAIWQPDEARYLLRLTGERENLRAVLGWAIEEDVEIGLRIAGALKRFWNYDGHFSEWRGQIEQLLRRGGNAPRPLRAGALSAAGWLALLEGDTATAVDRHREALQIERDLDNRAMIMWTLDGLGLAQVSGGDATSAATSFQEAIDISWELEVSHLRGPAEYGMGLTFHVQGDLDRAREHLQVSIELYRNLQERFAIGSSLRALGAVALAQGEYAQAQSLYQEGLQAALRVQHREGVATSLEGIAAALASLGHLERAARLWGAAEAVYEELHGPAGDGEVPLARLPQLSPHLSTIATRFSEPGWKGAQAKGYSAPLHETIASLEDIPAVSRAK